jgi:hypothetical protein
MSCPTDPGRSVYIQADVVTGDHGRLAGVNTHPHPQPHPLGPGMGHQRALRVHGGSHGVARHGKGNEERVPLGTDLLPAVLGESGPQQPPIFGQHQPVAIPKVLQ